MLIKKLFIFIVVCGFMSFQPFWTDSGAHAGNFGFGVHSGAGVIRYVEQSTVFGPNREAESSQGVIIVGGSGEYSFPRSGNFFAGLTIDYTLGLEDRETWKDDGSKFQINDMRVFGQFYDMRFGYKNSFVVPTLRDRFLDNLYYRLYLSGGWDGLYFERSDFVLRGSNVSGTSIEDFSLWRLGGGFGIGYKLDKWAVDARGSYGYYVKGTVENSSYPDISFDTNGTCLDGGIGIARELTEKLNFYTGVSYTLIELDESDVQRSGSTLVVFPNSSTEIMGVVVNLTYAF